MKNENVFAFSAYKKFIQSRVESDPNRWGLLTKLSEAAGCQRPYLSRVLSQEAHLTPAQIFGIARFWKLSEDETEFLLGLLEIERAGSSAYRDYWKKKNAELKRRQENLARVVDRESAINDEKNLIYYSSWSWTAVHILTSVPEFRTEKAIAERLSLPAHQVRSILMTLESWGAVKKTGHRWEYGAREQHISKNSPLAVFHHTNWRQKAMVDAQQMNPESVHYSVVQSLSRDDFEHIKSLVLDLIKKSSSIAGPSAPERLMAFTCDFFEP